MGKKKKQKKKPIEWRDLTINALIDNHRHNTYHNW